MKNCDSCVGVEAEHHQCDECVQDDIAAERALRAELVAVKAKSARQRSEIRRLRAAMRQASEEAYKGLGFDASDTLGAALAPKRGK